MADLGSYSHADRDIEQGLIALKKGAQLLKYGRKGKPKFCPFRVSNDESSLIWISSRGERSLKLASVSRIIPGQRTAVFQRYLRPDKDYLSFSLIYNDGKRSLDLICKDKVEAEVWIVSLKSLIASGKGRRSKIDGWTDGGLNFDVNRDLISDSPSDSSFSATQDISSSEGSLSSAIIASPMRNQPSNPLQSEQAYMAFDRTNMQAKGPGSDVFRVSVSSAPSTSSHGSAPDDCDALGDVYIWGDVICDNLVKLGPGKSSSPVCTRTDVLLPRLLESNLVLDVHHIACGVRHAALVTRQGELFTWGEESGGRLGHGVGQDFTRPHLVESLSICHVDFVACGEFHSLAVTVAGEIYSWGDGKHRAGLLGNGSDVSHWIPKRISGPLEGLQVVMVTCGPWHTALVTSNGQLFTFGIGTFGNLGHGDRENVLFPREIESLSGLRTIAVACGVWHTAAVVEVIVKQSSASVSSGKLFTWGDGDRNRLGHGDKEARLVPTCVPALIDYNFHKIACGHSLTVGLTTSGHVFTMGSTVYGQLGNPQSDGKLPCLVEDKLSGELVEEIACGAYHVAVLTAKNQVFSWGKGANGRLGHGDIEDRKTPTLIEALKDRHVKYVACGSNYSAAICLHKWVSGAEQSQCAACKQAFGFTRKRHNCYNCGLVYCNACTPRKALKAALAPNPGKPYRVCDPCFAKLTNVVEAGVNNRRNNNMPRLSGDKLDKAEIHLAKSVLPPSNIDLIKQLDSKAAKQGKKADIFSVGRSSYAPPFLQLKDVLLPTAIIDQQRPVPKQVVTPSIGSESVSPFSRKPSPPRSATPVPTTSGLSFSTSISDSLKKTNELLNQEIHKLRAQVESLTHQCQDKDIEVQKSTKKAQEAVALAAEESAKCKAAKEVIKSLTAQIKDMAERLPPGFGDTNGINLPYLSNGLETNGIQHLSTNTEGRSSSGSFSGSCLASPISVESASFNGLQGTAELPIGSGGANEIRHTNQIQGRARSLGQDIQSDVRLPNNNSETQSRKSNSSEATDNRDSPFHDGENGSNFRSAAVVAEKTSQVDREWIEQYEPGVYITLVALHDGTRDLKRVRFSRRRFGEHQAETWWSENRENVYERYNVRCSDKSSSVSGQAAAAARRSEGTVSLSSQI